MNIYLREIKIGFAKDAYLWCDNSINTSSFLATFEWIRRSQHYNKSISTQFVPKMHSVMARTYLKSDLFHHVLKTCERFTFIQNFERSNENNIKFDQGEDEKETDTKKAGRDLLEALKADRFSEN